MRACIDEEDACVLRMRSATMSLLAHMRDDHGAWIAVAPRQKKTRNEAHESYKEMRMKLTKCTHHHARDLRLSDSAQRAQSGTKKEPGDAGLFLELYRQSDYC
jgi:hypothetical protein